MIRTLALIVALLAATPAQADVFLNTGAMSLTLSPSTGWTIRTMTWNSYDVMIEPSSQNGTVLSVDGAWAGSGHGNETVLSKSIRVDGVLKTVSDGSTYSGQTIQFIRVTTLGNAYRLTSTLTVKSTGTDEQVVLDGLDASKSVDAGNAYGFLGTRNSGMTKYAAFSANKALLTSGTSVADNSYTYLKPAVAVAQYDAAAQKGVVSQVTAGTNLGLNPFIWNRGYDYKLYEDFGSLAGPAATTKHFTIRQTVTPFQAAPGSWIATAGALVTPEPGTITLLTTAIVGALTWAWGKKR
jgi:hypothetical protein